MDEAQWMTSSYAERSLWLDSVRDDIGVGQIDIDVSRDDHARRAELIDRLGLLVTSSGQFGVREMIEMYASVRAAQSLMEHPVTHARIDALTKRIDAELRCTDIGDARLYRLTRTARRWMHGKESNDNLVTAIDQCESAHFVTIDSPIKDGFVTASMSSDPCSTVPFELPAHTADAMAEVFSRSVIDAHLATINMVRRMPFMSEERIVYETAMHHARGTLMWMASVTDIVRGRVRGDVAPISDAAVVDLAMTIAAARAHGVPIPASAASISEVTRRASDLLGDDMVMLNMLGITLAFGGDVDTTFEIVAKVVQQRAKLVDRACARRRTGQA